MAKQTSKKRLPIIDALRGLTVISMVCYHFMWDVVYIYNGNFPWYKGLPGALWQQSICWSFILISGFCVGMSKKSFKRGLIVFLCGVMVSVVTLLFVPDMTILFGVLTMIGSAMIIANLLKDVLTKIPSSLGIGLFAVLFLLTKNVGRGFLGFGSINLLQIPKELYTNLFTAYLGFPYKGFYSTDYFGLVPWIFLFLVGFYIQRLYMDGWYHDGGGKPVPVLGAIGRGSLIIYMIHQPLIYGALYLFHLLHG